MLTGNSLKLIKWMPRFPGLSLETLPGSALTTGGLRLSGDMDASVLSKYISDVKRVYPAVEGRIRFRSSAARTVRRLGLLLLGLCLSLTR